MVHGLTASVNDPAAVHRRFVDEVVVGKRIGVIDELFAPNAALEQGSLDGLRAQMEEQAAALEGSVEYVNEIVDGDWVVHRMHVSITLTGEFMGQPPTGRTARFHEVEAARVAEGRIVEMWSVVDRGDVLRQLGIRIAD